MNARVYDFDVAISFLSRDEPLAQQLANALAPLQVFVYSKRQEDVAGTDGTEVFRDIFRDRARLAVVLYRPGWGETPWTRVEATAIQEMCLIEGWDRQCFVLLERGVVPPKWVPAVRIHFDLETYGFAGAVGAIRARCAELGAEARLLTLAERAAAQARREAFDRETAGLLGNSPAPFYEAMGALTSAIAEQIGAISTSTGWQFVHGPGEGASYIVRVNGLTLQLLPRELYANTARQAYLLARIVRGGIVTSEERAARKGFMHQPIDIAEARITLHRLQGFGWCWEVDNRVLPPREAADAILLKLLEVREHEASSRQ